MSSLPAWSDASDFDSDNSGSDGGRQRQEASDLSSPASAYEMLMPPSMQLSSGCTSPQAEAKESDDEKAPAEASSLQSQQSASSLEELQQPSKAAHSIGEYTGLLADEGKTNEQREESGADTSSVAGQCEPAAAPRRKDRVAQADSQFASALLVVQRAHRQAVAALLMRKVAWRSARTKGRSRCRRLPSLKVSRHLLRHATAPLSWIDSAH